MKYFVGITDFKIAKSHYRYLAKRMHPDRGGDTHKFQTMKDEYALVLNTLKDQSLSEMNSKRCDYDRIVNELQVLGVSQELIQSATKAIGNILSNVLIDYQHRNPESKKIITTLSQLLR